MDNASHGVVADLREGSIGEIDPGDLPQSIVLKSRRPPVRIGDGLQEPLRAVGVDGLAAERVGGVGDLSGSVGLAKFVSA